MSIFERYLTLWVALCIVAGVALGHVIPGVFSLIASAEVAKVNVPVAILIWLMIVPMLLKIDFGSLGKVREHWRGVGVTLFINWAVKPFSMALLGTIFIGHVFAPMLPATQIPSYIAGLILLAAAPCTAMVFVWSNLCEGEPNYTLSQVALNDVLMVFLFAPLVGFLLGVASITVPWATLLLSVPTLHRRPGRGRAVLAARTSGRRSVRSHDETAATGLADRTARDLGAPVRFPGRADRQAAGRHRDPRRADPDPGLFQRRSRLLALAPLRRRLVRGSAGRPDRRQQLLRACRRGRHQPFRSGFGGGPCHGGRGPRRGPVMLSVVRIVKATRGWYEAGRDEPKPALEARR